MAEIVRRRSWGGVLPLGRHASISGSSLIHCAFVSIAPSLFQERQNARIQKRFKLEQALAQHWPNIAASLGVGVLIRLCSMGGIKLRLIRVWRATLDQH